MKSISNKEIIVSSIIAVVFVGVIFGVFFFWRDTGNSSSPQMMRWFTEALDTLGLHSGGGVISHSTAKRMAENMVGGGRAKSAEFVSSPTGRGYYKVQVLKNNRIRTVKVNAGNPKKKRKKRRR